MSQLTEVSTHLFPEDRRRWAKLVEWVKYHKSMTNVQLGAMLGCSNSTVSDWINEKRTELHSDKLESMARLLYLPRRDLIKIIKEDSDLSFAQRMEMMRAAARDCRRLSNPSSYMSIEDILDNLYLLSPSELPKVIEAAVSRLDNLSNTATTTTRRDSSMSLDRDQRIKISKIVLVSAEYREKKGGFYEKGLDICRTTPFLRQILSAKGNDFFLPFDGIQCILEEPVKQAIVAFCYVVTWENGVPFVREPASQYGDFDQIIRSCSQEESKKNCRQV